VVYSVEFRYPKDYVLRRDGSLFCLLRMRCGHQQLTIRSAAECKNRPASRPRGIGHRHGSHRGPPQTPGGQRGDSGIRQQSGYPLQTQRPVNVDRDTFLRNPSKSVPGVKESP
jgi:hypothetical protein